MKNVQNYLKKTEGKFVFGVIAVVIALFAYYFYASPSSTSDTVEDISIVKTDHVRGAVNGTVTLVGFGDYQCPACAVYEPLVKQVIEDNKTVLKFVFKNFPLTQIHDNALIGAKAAEAAGMQGKFWEMHDMLYEKQREWSLGMNARDILMSYASALKLDTKKFSEDMNSKAVEDKIFAEMKEAIKLGVPGTPTFFLNGKRIESPSSLEAFDKLILEAAEASKSAPVTAQ